MTHGLSPRQPSEPASCHNMVMTSRSEAEAKEKAGERLRRIKPLYRMQPVPEGTPAFSAARRAVAFATQNAK